MLSGEKIKALDAFGLKFLELRDLAKKNISDVPRFEKYKENLFKELKLYVEGYTSYYKKFSNYQDLNQFGYEAILNSFNTFNSSKGKYSYWFHRYVGTKVVRQASAHSSIRIPIKKIKKNGEKPIKVDEIPEQSDFLTPEDICIKKQLLDKINIFLEGLNHIEKSVFCHYFNLDNKYSSVDELCSDLKISKQKFKQIINKCLTDIKE